MKSRRKFRYSLAGLLAAMLLIALPLAWVKAQLDRRDERVKELLSLYDEGVFLLFSYQAPDHWFYGYFEDRENLDAVYEVAFWGHTICDDDLAILDDLPNVAKVELDKTDITDEGLMRLAKHPRLKIVSIRSRVITKEGIARFRAARPDVQIERW